MKSKVLFYFIILTMSVLSINTILAQDTENPKDDQEVLKDADDREISEDVTQVNSSGASNRNDGFHRKSHLSTCYVRDYYTGKWKMYTSTECYTWTVVLCMFTECIGQTDFPTDI